MLVAGMWYARLKAITQKGKAVTMPITRPETKAVPRQEAVREMRDSIAADTTGPSQAEETWLANSEYGQGWQGTEVTEWQADLNDLIKMYAERSGYAYGFINGIMHKMHASMSLLDNCKSPECIQWVYTDLADMAAACGDQLARMEGKL